MTAQQNIHFKNVIKRYNDHLAIDQIDLVIPQGEIFGLLGPNGAGKTTLIAMLCGLVKIDKGDILVGESSIIKDSTSVKKRIGYVPQELALFEDLTVLENLNYFAGIYKLTGATKKERIAEALEVSALAEAGKKKVKTLSGGMKRRLNIACAIMHHPEILIMDEPTVGIDPQSRNHILEFAQQINKSRGTTILYTSHYMEEIQKICSRLAIIDQGRLLVEGSLETVLRSVNDDISLIIETTPPEKSRVNAALAAIKATGSVKGIQLENQTLTLSIHNEAYDLGSLLSLLTASGFPIHGLQTMTPNLETVFLSLTGKQLRDA